MGTLGSYAATISDWTRRLDPQGKIDKIVEILNLTNPILEDMQWVEGNLATGHQTTVRSGLPGVAWRLLNYGIQPSKSRTVQITDACGMLEAYADVDKDLADLNGNTAEFRLSEDMAFIEAMNQEHASTLFYGNTDSAPQEFLGLAPRYSSLSAENGGQIVNGAGTGSDNTSIWVVCWGANTIHGIFPKGSKAGLQHEDKGQLTLQDTQTPAGNYEGYRSHYQWKCGLTLRNWKYVSRVANIDVEALTYNAATGARIDDLLIQAVESIQNPGMGKMAIYCNKTITTYFRRQMNQKSNVYLTLEQVGAKKVLHFDGIPIRKCESILNTEATVS